MIRPGGVVGDPRRRALTLPAGRHLWRHLSETDRGWVPGGKNGFVDRAPMLLTRLSPNPRGACLNFLLPRSCDVPP
jgi:hypothetical protein